MKRGSLFEGFTKPVKSNDGQSGKIVSYGFGAHRPIFSYSTTFKFNGLSVIAASCLK